MLNQPNSEVEQLELESAKYHSLSALASSDGGKVLVETLLKDIVSCVDKLSYNYSAMTNEQFISIGAEIGAKLAVIRTLSRSENNKEVIDESLKEALRS
jgi:hypothetical protein